MKLPWKTCLRAGVTVVAVYLACTCWPALTRLMKIALSAATPLFVGAVIAYVVNILMSFYERHFFPRSRRPLVGKLRRPLCLLLAFLTVVLALVWLFTTVVPELGKGVNMLIANLPQALNQAYAWLEERFQVSQLLEGTSLPQLGADANWKDIINRAIDLVATGVGGAVGVAVSAVSSVASTVVMLFLAIVFAIYLMSAKERLAAQCIRLMRTYLGDQTTNRSLYVLRVLDDSFHAFIVGQCTEAFILGAMCLIGMMVLGFHYAMTISMLVGFTALIPIAGGYIAGVAGAFMLFVNSPLEALGFVIFLLVLQQIEGNLVFPRVVGSSIGLPGVWVLAAVTIGGGVMGIPGMLLGVPLASALYRLLGRDVRARQTGRTLFDMPHDERRSNGLFK